MGEGGGVCGGQFFSLLRLLEEREKGASVSNREMKRVDTHFKANLAKLNHGLTALFTFFYLGLGWEDGSAKIKNIIGGPM